MAPRSFFFIKNARWLDGSLPFIFCSCNLEHNFSLVIWSPIFVYEPVPKDESVAYFFSKLSRVSVKESCMLRWNLIAARKFNITSYFLHLSSSLCNCLFNLQTRFPWNVIWKWIAALKIPFFFRVGSFSRKDLDLL